MTADDEPSAVISFHTVHSKPHSRFPVGDTHAKDHVLLHPTLDIIPNERPATTPPHVINDNKECLLR